jgi:hexokinase
MYYWYDMVKIPIEWSGKFQNMHFSLTEYNTDIKIDMPTAKIEAQMINNKIIGTWKNEKTKKILKIELEEY